MSKFRTGLIFKEISASLLYEYENWLKDKEIFRTTIGMYIRPLRTLFKEAIEAGDIDQNECYRSAVANTRYQHQEYQEGFRPGRS